jgi:hypothetical protein
VRIVRGRDERPARRARALGGERVEVERVAEPDAVREPVSEFVGGVRAQPEADGQQALADLGAGEALKIREQGADAAYAELKPVIRHRWVAPLPTTGSVWRRR